MGFKEQKCEVWLYEHRGNHSLLSNYKREPMSLKTTISLYKEKYNNLGKSHDTSDS